MNDRSLPHIADYERMAWHLMVKFGLTAEAAVETIRLMLSDDPVDTAVMEDGIGVILNGLLNDGSIAPGPAGPDDGWDWAECACGWFGPPCPDKEIAAEFWADHLPRGSMAPEGSDG